MFNLSAWVPRARLRAPRSRPLHATARFARRSRNIGHPELQAHEAAQGIQAESRRDWMATRHNAATRRCRQGPPHLGMVAHKPCFGKSGVCRREAHGLLCPRAPCMLCPDAAGSGHYPHFHRLQAVLARTPKAGTPAAPPASNLLETGQHFSRMRCVWHSRPRLCIPTGRAASRTAADACATRTTPGTAHTPFA